MKVVAIACGKCGKHIKPRELKLLPFKHDQKNEQRIWWGCEECRVKLQVEVDKG